MITLFKILKAIIKSGLVLYRYVFVVLIRLILLPIEILKNNV